MDATTRWETEALRAGQTPRTMPPRPTSKQVRPAGRDNRPWVTLREAEEATGIPVNTLRKWVRKAGLDSYLESDGETPVRMVDLDAVRARAADLGRELTPAPPEPAVSHASGAPSAEPDTTEGREATNEGTGSTQSAVVDTTTADESPHNAPETMIVPVDAWNKMLSQLGNLHEAGQQLAAATERAAKAETEAMFLRERLAELRHEGSKQPAAPPVAPPDDRGHPSASDEGQVEDTSVGVASPETTSYWRYVTTGWRQRRRRSKD